MKKKRQCFFFFFSLFPLFFLRTNTVDETHLKNFLHPSRKSYPSDQIEKDNEIADESFDPDDDDDGEKKSKKKKNKKESASGDVDASGYFDHGNYLKGKKFCMSGALSMVRKDLARLIEAAGGI